MIVALLVAPGVPVWAASGASRGTTSNLWNDNANWTGAASPNAPGEVVTFDNRVGVQSTC